MCNHPREHDYPNSNESPHNSHTAQIVGAHHDVVHVAGKSRHDHQHDVDNDEAQKSEHVQKVD